MSLIRRDNNELRFNAIWLLSKEGNPDYYKQLFRNTRALFMGLQQEALLNQLDKLIHNKLEKKLNRPVQNILFVYKNLRHLKSIARSRDIKGETIEVYKYTLEQWLDEVEKWIFQKCIEVEPLIRFTIPAKQHI